MASTKRNELIHRLLADRCELCDSRTDIEVHHIRKLADLNRHDRPDRPAWVHLMAKRRRKTIVTLYRSEIWFQLRGLRVFVDEPIEDLPPLQTYGVEINDRRRRRLAAGRKLTASLMRPVFVVATRSRTL